MQARFSSGAIFSRATQSYEYLFARFDAGSFHFPAVDLREYNLARIPKVLSRRPLWDIKPPEDPDWRYE